MPKGSISTSADSHFINDYRPGMATRLHGNERFYLGIDGGASKTHAVVTDAALRVIGEGWGGPSNPARVGVEESVSNVVQAIIQACAAANIAPDQITAACVALAGVGDPAHYDPMNHALTSELSMIEVELVTDARAALEGALDGEPGVVVIAGTGSIAMGVNESGEQVRSGGWGPTLGDEGSGYDIARQALKSVAAAFDGRAPRTYLTELICARLGIETAADLPAAIYNGDFEHAEIASLAEYVCEAAQEGDPLAQSILDDAGRNLGELASSVVVKLGLGAQPFRVACVGSVFNSGEFVLRPLREAVASVAPRAMVGPPLYSPAIGAVKLARKHQYRER